MVFWITDGSTTNIAKDKLEIIGKGVEDMPISMNPETEEIQDVLGNNNYDITGYADTKAKVEIVYQPLEGLHCQKFLFG